MKRLVVAFALIALFCGFRGGLTTDQPPSQFQSTLRIGAGGWLTGLDINPDGTKLARADIYGGYVYDPASTACGVTGCWSQIKTQSRMPATNFGYVGSGTTQINYNGIAGGAGIYEMSTAPSNSSIGYAMIDGWIFKTTNKFASLSLTGSGTGSGFNSPTGATATPVAMATNASNNRQCGRKMAIDPLNPAIVFAGTDAIGLFNTSNSGALWNPVSGVPTSTGSASTAVNYLIAFDPTSGSGSVTQTIYAWTNGTTAGVYVSTDAGVHWALTTNSPSTGCHLIVDQTGVAWLVDSSTGGANGNLWKLSSPGGAWVKVTSLSASATAHSVAVDPANANHIVTVSAGGTVNTSVDRGVTWSGYTSIIRSASDIPWLAAVNELSMSNGDAIFDPSQCAGGAGNCTLIFGEGIGVWSSNPPNSNAQLTWTSMSAGIEELVPRDIMAPNGVPIAAVSDRSTFDLGTSNAFPLNYNTTYRNTVSLNVNWAEDWATSNSSYMAAVIGDINGTTPFDNSGFSTDGGQNWNIFHSYLQDVSSSVLSSGTGGVVRLTLPSTTGLTTWVAGSGSLVRIIPYNPTINSCSIGAIPNVSLRKFWPITVDPVAGAYIELQGTTYSSLNLTTTCGSLIVAVQTNPLTSNDGFYTVTNVTDNGSGKVRVTVNSTSSAQISGAITCITGVVMTGATVVNGCWQISGQSGNGLDLDLSSFVPGDTWSSGGVANKFIPQGGSIAVSTPLNMILVGGGKDYPQCTTDGGLTWTELHVPAAIGIGGTTGWLDAATSNRRILAADRVTANRMYMYNYLNGTYTVDNCTITATNAAVVGATNVNSTMKSLEGYAGYLLLAPGPQGGAGPTVNHPNGGALRWSSNAGAAWNTVATTGEAIAVATGAIAPGSDFPTVYMVGWISNVYGIWRTTGKLADWQSGSNTGTSLVWTQVATYPLGLISNPVLGADQTVWNKWYGGLAGSGFTYGKQNFLLERDLHPGSNDNSPVGLAKVA